MKLLFALANSEKIIKNVNIPSCVHFKPYYSSDFTSSLSKCGTKDITDKISYNEVADMTRDETKCGIEGKFEQEKNIELKIFIHQRVSGLPNILLTTTFVFYMVALLKL